MNYPDLPNKTCILVAEAAHFFNVSQRTIRRWYHAGLIEGARVHGSLWIDRKSLVGLIDPNEGKKQDKSA